MEQHSSCLRWPCLRVREEALAGPCLSLSFSPLHSRASRRGRSGREPLERLSDLGWRAESQEMRHLLHPRRRPRWL